MTFGTPYMAHNIGQRTAIIPQVGDYHAAPGGILTGRDGYSSPGDEIYHIDDATNTGLTPHELSELRQDIVHLVQHLYPSASKASKHALSRVVEHLADIPRAVVLLEQLAARESALREPIQDLVDAWWDSREQEHIWACGIAAVPGR